MSIRYYLQPNPITPDPNDQSARVLTNQTFSVDDLIKLMLRRGSTLTEADIRATLFLLFRVVVDEVREGNSVLLPICNIRPGITGVFTSATDSYDSSRHTIKASISAGNELYASMQTAQVEKVLQPMPSPYLLEFTDVVTGATNSKLSPGGIGQIVGEELKFNPANVTDGIYFVALGDGSEAKVSVIANRTEGKLVFSIPASLPKGSYRLEVRRAYGVALTLRTGTLIDPLIVT